MMPYMILTQFFRQDYRSNLGNLWSSGQGNTFELCFKKFSYIWGTGFKDIKIISATRWRKNLLKALTGATEGCLIGRVYLKRTNLI